MSKCANSHEEMLLTRLAAGGTLSAKQGRLLEMEVFFKSLTSRCKMARYFSICGLGNIRSLHDAAQEAKVDKWCLPMVPWSVFHQIASDTWSLRVPSANLVSNISSWLFAHLDIASTNHACNRYNFCVVLDDDSYLVQLFVWARSPFPRKKLTISPKIIGPNWRRDMATACMN